MVRGASTVDEDKTCEFITLAFSECTATGGRERLRELVGAAGSILVSGADEEHSNGFISVQGLDDNGAHSWEFYVPAHRVTSVLVVSRPETLRYSAVIVDAGSQGVAENALDDTSDGVQDAYRKHDDGIRDA